MLEAMKSASIEDRLAGANVAAAISAAATLLAKGIKAQAVALLEGIDPAIVRDAAEYMDAPVELIKDLQRVMGNSAIEHLEKLKR